MPFNAGECRTDSSAGDRYVSVPFAAGENQCLTNQYEEVAPCFFNASPVAGKIQQMDISGPFDKNGSHQRMLPTAFTGIGGQYQYSEPKMSPDGAWMFVPCWWLNGVRSEVCGVYLPPFPVADSVVRTSYRTARCEHFRHIGRPGASLLGLCGKRSRGWFAEQFVSHFAAGTWLFHRIRCRGRAGQ